MITVRHNYHGNITAQLHQTLHPTSVNCEGKTGTQHLGTDSGRAFV